MSGWKPIKAKPRPQTGAPFLAYDAESGQMAVCYVSTDRTLCYDAGERIVEDDEFLPTHWMELPPPPPKTP
jgi:hypothetical protein